MAFNANHLLFLFKPHKIFCPVFAQSLVNCSSPLSVKGCEIIALITAGGAVTTSAPMRAAWVMWLALRIEAARIFVV